MNVLPLVSAFILIFAICSYTFFYNVSAAVQEKTHFQGAHRIQRKFASLVQSKLYTKMKGEKGEAKPTSSKEQEEFKSPRDHVNLPPEAKLNIRVLLADGDRLKKEAIFLELTRNLYEFTTIYYPGLENDLLETLKQNPKITNFDELLPKAPKFYKLIKGTHRYKLGRFEGYPALQDFFIFEESKNGKLVDYCHAARPVLEAVFGKLIAPKIINEEKHKWEQNKKHIPLTKQELEAFLLTISKNIVAYEPFLYFKATRHAQTHEVILDGASRIQLKIQK